MPTTTVLLIILAFLAALALAGFQYFYKAKGNRVQNFVFAALRFVTLFSIFLLLINPRIRKTELYTEKPKLLLAVDNSASISNFQRSKEVQQYVRSLTEDRQLSERFDIEVFGFGKEINPISHLEFGEDQTNISNALKELDSRTEDEMAPTVLITDGNQTFGEDLTYSIKKYTQPVYPVIIGDTSLQRDLAVSRINVNRYAFLNNRFPVEMMFSYTGNERVKTRIEITSGQNTLFSQELNFDKDNTSAVIMAELPASSVGTKTYTARILPFAQEKNVTNNNQEFAVEVIDERSSILVLYKTLHPDLGTLKKTIESNQQREVVLMPVAEEDELQDYQLVILYQPTAEFVPVLEQLQKENRNYWIITGPQTDWKSLNNSQELFQQEITGQTEELLPVFNKNFGLFQIDDPGFSKMPPLTGSFGKLTVQKDPEILLFQEIQGVETNEPLLAISEENSFKTAFLLGADIWKWRSQSYREQGNFEAFDDFFGKLIQFLSENTRKDRLTVSYETLYRGSEELIITAKYFDRNYVFDNKAELRLQLKNSDSGKVREIPFMLRNNNYEVDLSDLTPGEYDFTVKVPGEGLSRSGNFRLLSFDVEKQFTGANTAVLRAVAREKGERLYFPDKSDELKKKLLTSKSYVPIQKSRENNVPLIDWYYLLGIIVLSLSGEWFLRKYYGYI